MRARVEPERLHPDRAAPGCAIAPVLRYATDFPCASLAPCALRLPGGGRTGKDQTGAAMLIPLPSPREAASPLAKRGPVPDCYRRLDLYLDGLAKFWFRRHHVKTNYNKEGRGRWQMMFMCKFLSLLKSSQMRFFSFRQFSTSFLSMKY